MQAEKPSISFWFLPEYLANFKGKLAKISLYKSQYRETDVTGQYRLSSCKELATFGRVERYRTYPTCPRVWIIDLCLSFHTWKGTERHINCEFPSKGCVQESPFLCLRCFVCGCILLLLRSRCIWPFCHLLHNSAT